MTYRELLFKNTEHIKSIPEEARSLLTTYGKEVSQLVIEQDWDSDTTGDVVQDVANLLKLLDLTYTDLDIQLHRVKTVIYFSIGLLPAFAINIIDNYIHYGAAYLPGTFVAAFIAIVYATTMLHHRKLLSLKAIIKPLVLDLMQDMNFLKDCKEV